MTPGVRAIYAELGDVPATRLLERLGEEPGPNLIADRWHEVTAAAEPAAAREIWFDREVWPWVPRTIVAAWFACLALTAAAVPVAGAGAFAPRATAALGIYVGYAAGIVWLKQRLGSRPGGLAAFIRPLLAAAAPLIAMGLWPAATPWTAPAALGIATFLLAFVLAASVPRVALLGSRHRRPQPAAVWFLVQALVESGGLDDATSPGERNRRLLAAIHRLDRAADLLERSMHRGWDRARAAKLRTSFCGIAASFREYGDELAWQWAPDAVDCLAGATVAVATGEWNKLRSRADAPPTGRRRRSRAVAKRMGLAVIPFGLIAVLWLLPVGAEPAVLTSLTVSALVWSIDYVVGAMSPELGAELSSIGKDVLPALF